MSSQSTENLQASFKNGDLRALTRAISLAENKEASVLALLAGVFDKVGKARVLGITGPPGAGKSSLANLFVRFLREKKKKVAVLAVDPVSPFTGGALLGDRIRLADHFNDEGVFIRSLSTRGKLGGLSLATREAVHLCDAFGFDYVLIETVGVGQSEVDIRKIADLAVVVLVPDWGDGVQALKAGILEIGEHFIVNKSDREGADRVVNELRNMLQISGRPADAVSSCSTHDVPSVEKVFSSLENQLEHDKAAILKKREASCKEMVGELLSERVLEETRNWVQKNVANPKNPYAWLTDFLKANPLGSLFK
jgi:LAO/AO transport system kinase